MNVDRIARAMTGGRPHDGFTARVMAPIYGRPRPDFTARVMARLEVAQPFRPVAQPFRARVLIIPTAIAIAAGVVLLRPLRATLPPAPDAPRIAATPDVSTEIGDVATLLTRPPVPLVMSQHASRSPGAVRVVQQTEGPMLEPVIYMIDALETPAEIAMTSITPVSVTVAPLAAPAPLTVPELRGSKEKS